MSLAGILARYRAAGVLVDTNLLLLYFVGAFSPDEVPRFKRTVQFTPEDHHLLVRFLGYSQYLQHEGIEVLNFNHLRYHLM